MLENLLKTTVDKMRRLKSFVDKSLDLQQNFILHRTFVINGQEVTEEEEAKRFDPVWEQVDSAFSKMDEAFDEVNKAFGEFNRIAEEHDKAKRRTKSSST